MGDFIRPVLDAAPIIVKNTVSIPTMHPKSSLLIRQFFVVDIELLEEIGDVFIIGGSPIFESFMILL